MFFTSWKSPSKTILILRLWDFILPYLFWGIWKEHNGRVSRVVESNYDQVFYKIKALMIENIKTNGSGRQHHNNWEEKLIQNWNLSGLSMNQKGINLRDNAKWDSHQWIGIR